MTSPSEQQATLFRMATDTHTCPFGLKAKAFLQRNGFTVDDNLLKTREAIDAFKTEHGVKTTPQIFIDGERIGGYDDLRHLFGQAVTPSKARSYRPVIVVFAVAALMALATGYAGPAQVYPLWVVQRFVAFSMCILAMLKLQDIETFSNTFLGYDLLAKRWLPYAYIYPFAEALAGLLMVSGALNWLSVPIALLIGTVGAASVFKAVYIDKRDLKCACVGGDRNVPLGFISLSENTMMVLMAISMLII